MPRLFSTSALAALLIVAMPAIAAVLYDDGPVNGTQFGWTINFGFAVGDSFPLGSPSTVTGVTFDSLTFEGDTISQVDWEIASLPDGTGTTYGTGTASVAATFLFAGSGFTVGLDVNFNSFSIPPLNL